jgi:hypothetical protein
MKVEAGDGGLHAAYQALLAHSPYLTMPAQESGQVVQLGLFLPG